MMATDEMYYEYWVMF